MKQKALKGDVVAVWWLDARAVSGPLDGSEARKLQGLPMLSVGILMSDEGNAVRFAQDWYQIEDGAERVRDVSVIPKAYITKMRKWKL